jgi:hypothetical protein
MLSCGSASAAEAPTFERYPVSAAAVGKPAPVRLDSPNARRYRTMLRDGAREGPNFAGHYTVVTWGCGAGCQTVAIVDAMTGRAFFPAQLEQLGHAVMPDEPLQYRLDSSLLIVAGMPGESGPKGVYYYYWNGSVLKQLHFVARDANP